MSIAPVHLLSVFPIPCFLRCCNLVKNAPPIAQNIPAVLPEHASQECNPVSDCFLTIQSQILRQRCVALIAIEIKKIIDPERSVWIRLGTEPARGADVPRPCQLNKN